MSKFKAEETEIRAQPHLMLAEGTTDEQPTREEVVEMIKSRGYEATRIDIWYDHLIQTWRWTCDISNN